MRSPDASSCAPAATNLEAALEKVAATPAARDGTVVLVTDGWQNHGDAERALGAIRSAGVRLYIFTPPGARGIPNVAITGLTMPPGARQVGAVRAQRHRH